MILKSSAIIVFRCKEKPLLLLSLRRNSLFFSSNNPMVWKKSRGNTFPYTVNIPILGLKPTDKFSNGDLRHIYRRKGKHFF